MLINVPYFKSQINPETQKLVSQISALNYESV